MKKRIISLFLSLTLLLSFVGCNNDNGESESNTESESVSLIQLSAPTNLRISDTGLISWNEVENATGYTVTIGTLTYDVTENCYQVENLNKSFRYSVVATAEGYETSPSSEQKTYTFKPSPTSAVTIAVKGNSEVKSGQSITLTATVQNSDNQEVTWKIVEGGEFATIENGVLTAKEVTGDKTVVIEVTSVKDSKVSTKKVVNILAKPALTQNMLDVFDGIDTVGFEGYVGIDLYQYDPLAGDDDRGAYYNTYTMVIKTAMDGTNWYTEYEDGLTGATNSLYYKNVNGYANQVGLSFMNDEDYFPMQDEKGNNVTWVDAGLYNNFKNLVVSDFEFNQETWRYEYKGLDNKLADKILASANPYDFSPLGFSLILGDGEVLGVYSVSKNDYSIMEGYVAVQKLFVAINKGDEVGEVPTISKYTHEDIHDDLGVAIQNMQSLTSYKVDLRQYGYSVLASGETYDCFEEIITEDDCFFTPYTLSFDAKGNEKKIYTKDYINDFDATYGYQKKGNDFYNAYYNTADGFIASRAYHGDFDSVKPSFGFAPELFRTYYTDEEDGSTTYYVEDLMSQIATTFYYGVGNDIALYGIFAQRGYTESSSFTPYVKVKDGYITEAGFYYYLGYLYGVMIISYSDFDTATIPEGVNIEFETREVPTKWQELQIEVSSESGKMDDDVSKNAFDYLNTFMGANSVEVTANLLNGVISWQKPIGANLYLVTVNGTATVLGDVTSYDTGLQDSDITSYSVIGYDKNEVDNLPFFGTPLGDTYGFGLNQMRLAPGEKIMRQTIGLYYDVPLDIDYTITSSLDKIDEYLIGLGYEKNSQGVYKKGDLCVQPVDSSLDLFIYMWLNK